MRSTKGSNMILDNLDPIDLFKVDLFEILIEFNNQIWGHIKNYHRKHHQYETPLYGKR